jgi:hypothetical protein
MIWDFVFFVLCSTQWNYYDDKYLMTTYRIEKQIPSMEALMMERATKVIEYANLFILVERNFVKHSLRKITISGQ